MAAAITASVLATSATLPFLFLIGLLSMMFPAGEVHADSIVWAWASCKRGLN